MDMGSEDQQINPDFGRVDTHRRQLIERSSDPMVQTLDRLDELDGSRDLIFSRWDRDIVLESKSSEKNVTAHGLSTSASAML
jgi:hypothetical protein